MRLRKKEATHQVLDRAGRASLEGYPSGREIGSERVRIDFLRVAAPGKNLHKSLKDRVHRQRGRLGRYEQVEGIAGARVCPGRSSCQEGVSMYPCEPEEGGREGWFGLVNKALEEGLAVDSQVLVVGAGPLSSSPLCST